MSDTSSQLLSRQPRHRQPPIGFLNSPTLISLVQRHPCIWDATRHDNRDRNAKTAAWEFIASRFHDADAPACKAKWESLKNAKNTWKRRHPPPLSGAEAPAPKASKGYKYARLMSFLESVNVKDNRLSTLSESSETSDNETSDNESVYGEVTQTRNENSQSQHENSQSQHTHGNAMDYTIKLADEDHESRIDFLRRVASSPLKPMNRDSILASSPLSGNSPLTVIKNEKNVKKEILADHFGDHVKNVKQRMGHFGDNFVGDEMDENIADSENIPPKKNVIRRQKEKKVAKPKIKKAAIIVNSENESDAEMMDENMSPKKAKLSKREKIQKAHAKRREDQCLLIRQRATEQMQRDNVEKAVKNTPDLQTLLVQELTAKADNVAHFAMSLVERLRDLPARTRALCEVGLLKTLISFEDLVTEPNTTTITTSAKEKLQHLIPISPLSTAMQVQIDEVLYCQDNDERQVGDTKFNLSLKARDLKCLQPGFWLTDLIIDYYFGLIAESNPRIYSLTSHFYPKLVQEGFEGVKEWFSNADVFSYDKILIPIFKNGNHWCLAVIDVIKTQIRYYDSMNGQNLHCASVLLSYLESKWKQKIPTESLPSFLWSYKHMKAGKKIPKQLNGHDCGIFICLFAHREGQGCSPSGPEFRQEDMAYWRKRLVWSIVNGQLLF